MAIIVKGIRDNDNEIEVILEINGRRRVIYAPNSIETKADLVNFIRDKVAGVLARLSILNSLNTNVEEKDLDTLIAEVEGEV